jgi:hypothetical protein
MSIDPMTCVLEGIFGKSYSVFEVVYVFTHKDTGKMRVGKNKGWCWSPAREKVAEFMLRHYKGINTDARYLETVDVMITPITIFVQPNPSNIRDMEKGEPFEFKMGKPGVLFDKWGY